MSLYKAQAQLGKEFKMFKKYTFLTAVFITLILSGCGNSHEVNDENCKIENIKSITDTSEQKDFAAKCLRR